MKVDECNQQERRPGLVAVPEGGLWDCERVAAFLGVSKSWVWKQVRENLGLPYVTLGARNYRFDPAKVRAWVQAQSKSGQAG
ncbi:helix-turn-helix transcriptional regulator [Cystobacter fuscus]|uniref:helix-turn-helix transcriptional regulator n=1 Tax=Cystobacter fuscus TaxID=43 RepID=UPI001FE18D2F|nr:helix-turn-helix domain-containing protein [Cystobacter fuscus]